MTKLKECFGNNLKRYRKLRHITQEQLAERAGTSTTYIGTMEIGQKFPSEQMIEKIAKALDIDSIQLFQTSEAFPAIQDAVNMDGLKKDLVRNVKTVIEQTIKQY